MTMKLNIAYPTNGSNKLINIEDEMKLIPLYDKRISQEFEADFLGEQFKGYVFRITGGCDKQGFPMKQGIMVPSRVRLLLRRGENSFRAWRGRNGERRRKSVRGCIVGPDISLLNLTVVNKGETAIEGLTDVTHPRRLGPKRASKIRKLFNLGKEDDVRKYVIRRVLPQKEGSKRTKSKAPKIQRLVTPVCLQRRRRKRALIKQRRAKSAADRSEFVRMLRIRRIKRQLTWKAKNLRQRQGALRLIKQKLAQEFATKLAARQALAAARKEKEAKEAAKASQKKTPAKSAPKKAAKQAAKPAAKPTGKASGKKK